MGYLRPTAIIVGCWDSGRLGAAHDEALRIFGEAEMESLVSPIVSGIANGEQSFLIGWDGSKEGWEASDRADAARAEFVAYLRSTAHEDGSFALDWVELQYGGDDRIVRALAHDGEYLEAEVE